MRVLRSILIYEVTERARDRWVWVVSGLFALLAGAVSLYGRAAEMPADLVTGPSLVTLSSLFVPLVALVLGHDAICGERERNTLGLLLSLPVSPGGVLLAKYAGRLCALVLAIGLGLGLAALPMEASGAAVLLALAVPTMCLGAAFLSLGFLLSVAAARQATAISLVVATWFLLVFFYDLGLLGLLIASDGAVSDVAARALALGNPAGLYRVELIAAFTGGAAADAGTGFDVVAPAPLVSAALWLSWIGAPLGVAMVWLTRQKVLK